MAEEADDFSADILAAVQQVESATPGSTGELGALAKDMPSQGDDSQEAKAQRARDEAGRFAKQEAKQETKQDAVDQPTDPAQDAKPLQEAKPGADQEIAVPGSWKAAAQPLWKDIPALAKAEIARREQEFSRTVNEKVSELSRVKGQYDEIEQVLGPRRELLALNYGSVGKALNQLFTLSDLASKSPKDFLAWYSQNTGTDLKALVADLYGEGNEGRQQPIVPPEIQQRITGLETTLTRFQQQQQESALADRARQMQAVAEEKDSTGNLVRPFFKELMEKGQIGPLLPMLAQQNPGLSAGELARLAYDKAVRLDDDVFSRIQQTKQQRDAEEKAQRERAEAAQRAAKSSPGDAPNRFTPSSGGSNNIRDDVAAAVHAAYGTSARL